MTVFVCLLALYLSNLASKAYILTLVPWPPTPGPGSLKTRLPELALRPRLLPLDRLFEEPLDFSDILILKAGTDFESASLKADFKLAPDPMPLALGSSKATLDLPLRDRLRVGGVSLSSTSLSSSSLNLIDFDLRALIGLASSSSLWSEYSTSLSLPPSTAEKALFSSTICPCWSLRRSIFAVPALCISFSCRYCSVRCAILRLVSRRSASSSWMSRFLRESS